MNVRINGARRDDAAFAGDHFGGGADDHIFMHAILNIGIARFANANNQAIAQPDIGFDDAPMVNNQRVGNDGI